MKSILLPVALIVLILSCNKKMTPAKTEMPSNNSSAPVIMDKPSTDNATASSTTASVPGKVDPNSAVKTVERAGSADAAAIEGQSTFNAKCGRCHALKIASDYTVDRWISIMQVMATKAHLSDIEKENVLAYVKANAKK